MVSNLIIKDQLVTAYDVEVNSQYAKINRVEKVGCGNTSLLHTILGRQTEISHSRRLGSS